MNHRARVSITQRHRSADSDGVRGMEDLDMVGAREEAGASILIQSWPGLNVADGLHARERGWAAHRLPVLQQNGLHTLL